MDGFGPSTYGDAFADIYDTWYGDLPGLADTVTAVARLAGGGPVLELGCGTGRLALPLARMGVQVHGLDSSAPMLDRLRAKLDHGSFSDVAVVTHQADMARFDLVGTPPFSVVFLAFNSLFNLPEEADQAGCLAAAARHLALGGRLALECVVPGDAPARIKDAVELHSIGVDRVVLRISRQDPAKQTVTGQHVELTEDGGVRLRPWYLRYVTPAQLDALASAAGFELEDRWADWAGTPFDAEALTHVSVYRLTAPPHAGGAEPAEPAEPGAPPTPGSGP